MPTLAMLPPADSMGVLLSLLVLERRGIARLSMTSRNDIAGKKCEHPWYSTLFNHP